MTASRTDESWRYSPDHGQLCRVIETQTLWGETVCRVWLPGKDTVVRLPATRLRHVHEASVGTVTESLILPPWRARPPRDRPQGGLEVVNVV